MLPNDTRLFEGILLLSDLDGTLLNSKKEIPQRNLDAIREFTQRGGLFSIATGRCPLSAKMIVTAAEINCPAVTLNGAVVYDYRTDTMVASDWLPAGYRPIVDAVRRQFPHIGIQLYAGSDIYLVVSNDVVIRQLTIERLPYRSSGDYPERLNKILFGGETDELKLVQAYLKGRLPDGIQGIFTEHCYYELLPAVSNKGRGAKSVAKLLNISPPCVAAAGDYYNDIELLTSVAYPMVAGNAPDDIKLLARYVTGDCDGGVVADAIEHLGERLYRKRLQNPDEAPSLLKF